MRLLLPLMFLLGLLLSPLVVGQGGPQSALIVETVETSTDIANVTSIQIVMARLCPNAAMVLEAQTVHMQVQPQHGSNWTVAGPAQGQFAQQVCAQQMKQPITASATVHPNPSAFAYRDVAHAFVFRVRADQASVATPAIPEQMVPFTVMTAALPPEPVIEEPERESPGLGLAGALVALAALAFIARRR